MAEADPQIDIRAKSSTKSRRFARLALLASVPLLLVGGATAYYIVNDHYVSTDNAYVQQDKVSISAEVGGRIVDVAVRENDVVKEGDQVKVKVLGVDDRGKVKLSMKVVDQATGEDISASLQKKKAG